MGASRMKFPKKNITFTTPKHKKVYILAKMILEVYYDKYTFNISLKYEQFCVPIIAQQMQIFVFNFLTDGAYYVFPTFSARMYF